MNVAENLYDYLKVNDKAELIGFGTFYIKSSSAKINDMKGIIEPPKREVFFTREQTDDRSFVSFMASHEFISEDTAYTWIKQYSDSLNEKILAGKKIVLGKLGKIEKGLLEEYTFTPSDELKFWGNSFALESLQNVQTFDTNEEKLNVIHTRQKQEDGIVEQGVLQDFEDKKLEIEDQIANAKQLKEENKIKEAIPQTEQRIIQHSEVKIESTVDKPQNITEGELKININNISKQDITQQTINRAAEFKENILVEHIGKLDEREKKEDAQDVRVDPKQDELIKQAEEIIRRHTKMDGKGRKAGHSNGRMKRWLVLLWIILVLLIFCLTFIGAHWMGLLKDIKELKPITDKLSYYITAKDSEVKEVEQVLNQTKTDIVGENLDVDETSSQDDNEKEKSVDVYSQNNNVKSHGNVSSMSDNKVKRTKKQPKHQKEQEKPQNNTMKPKEEVLGVDNTPVIIQSHSKLGFDVVSGVYSDKSKAEEQARKAKRLGYDGYVITKIKGGTSVYYTSYGSRRTNSDAIDLCTMIKSRLGGSFYVISR